MSLTISMLFSGVGSAASYASTACAFLAHRPSHFRFLLLGFLFPGQLPRAFKLLFVESFVPLYSSISEKILYAKNNHVVKNYFLQPV